jgi:hypothetical protein
MNFLRFPDKSAWTTAAAEAGFLIDDTLTAYTHGHAIDVVGTIPDMDGWHINFVGKLPEDWSDYLVNPVSPFRVFA